MEILESVFNMYAKNKVSPLSAKKSKNDNLNESKLSIEKSRNLANFNSSSKQQKVSVNSASNKNFQKNDIKTCPKLEFYVQNENDQIDMSMSFEIFYGVQCRDFPVYKSKENFYLFRNYYGHWCQDLLEFFQISKHCPNNCTQMKLLNIFDYFHFNLT